MKALGRILLSTAVVFTSGTVHAKPEGKRKPSSLVRPPQFVLMGFDGSKANDFWQESMDAAEKILSMGGTSKLRFTYFVNPPYYNSPANGKKNYITPRLGKAVSCIGWASDEGEETALKSIPLRISLTNKAFKAGHEIASHANSHCDASGEDRDNPLGGKPWGESDWDSEFFQFNKLLFNAFDNNNLKPIDGTPGNGFVFGVNDIKGFRAPLLAVTAGLWPTLKKYNFTYDTSRDNAPDYWPVRQSWGGWDIPLARIKIAGTSRTVFSMDYNWLCFHSACETKPGLTEAERSRMEKQVFDSYMYYFKKNYFGNRAPVQIGHHFSQWNKGAYWSAMKDVAVAVCNRPEVRCVTFSEYVKWLDAQDKDVYQEYRVGKFEHLKDDGTIRDIATPITVDIRLDFGAERFEAVVPESDKGRLSVTGWTPQVKVDFAPQGASFITREQLAEIVKKKKQQGLASSVTVRASLVNRKGYEAAWQTYRVDNFGTANETITGPLENNAMKGETAEAHGAHSDAP